MSKKLYLSLFICELVLLASSSYAVSLDSVDHYISCQHKYDLEKENYLEGIRQEIALGSKDLNKMYDLYVNMYENYRSYIYDSAYVCVEKLIAISSGLKDKDKFISSQVKAGFCYLSSGLFKEAYEVLSGLDVKDCSAATKAEYYTCKARMYFDLADYNKSERFRKKYNEMGNQLADSAIMLLQDGSASYWLTLGLKHMKARDFQQALSAFQKIVESKTYSEHDYAIATSSIAHIYDLMGYEELATGYLVKAAIADIKASVKETVALRNLAYHLYKDKDINRAVKYIRKALDDASFYNARHRQVEIGQVLPIIEREQISIIENQRDRIIIFTLFISVLSIALFAALYIIWKSYGRLKFARLAIEDSNNKLTEANKIKDEYIAYFFNQNAEFIEKIEKLQKWVNQKVAVRQFEELKNLPQKLDVHNERKALFERFDRLFLKLFPDFVDEFNKLLKRDEQIKLRKGELLSTDLRIYALIRLGINDNEKIATFLDYSVNTVYTYKTKLKNKAACPSEQFIKKVLDIKSL